MQYEYGKTSLIIRIGSWPVAYMLVRPRMVDGKKRMRTQAVMITVNDMDQRKGLTNSVSIATALEYLKDMDIPIGEFIEIAEAQGWEV